MKDLRAVTPDDLEPLTALWHEGWRDGHLGIVPDHLIRFRTVETFRRRIELSLDDCFVTGEVGTPIGFVRLKGDELDQFYVRPDQRGNGLAIDLMAAAETMLSRRGVSEAHLLCAAGNARAARFYDKCGWHRAGISMERVETLADPVSVEVIRFEKSL